MYGFELCLGDLGFGQDGACGDVDVVVGVVGIELGHGLFVLVDVE